MISHKYKCIFIHIPKCAGTSIETALGHLDNHSGRGGQDHRSIRMIENPLKTPYVFYSKENFIILLYSIYYKVRKLNNPKNKITVTKNQFNNYFKFAVVRNPWARAFSWYKNVMRDPIQQKKLKISGHISFNKFLHIYAGKGALRPQTYWIKNFKGKIPLDYIAFFETLSDDFQEVCKALQIDRLTLPHVLGSSDKYYQSHYDKDSINLIEKVYKEEIDTFNYTFES